MTVKKIKLISNVKLIIKNFDFFLIVKGQKTQNLPLITVKYPLIFMKNHQIFDLGVFHSDKK